MLTYILREQKEFSAATCFTFAPGMFLFSCFVCSKLIFYELDWLCYTISYLHIVFLSAACMTWELAESGKHFITTIVNGSDLVPTFSAASVDDLRSEVPFIYEHIIVFSI